MSNDPNKRKRGRPRIDRPPKVPKPRGPGSRPHVWRSGPDEFRHSMYSPFLKARAQANFRGEGWGMDFDEFYDLWKNDWQNRGRLSHQMCMSRVDDEKPWTRDNTYIRLRYEQLLEQAKKRIGQGKHQRALK